MKKRKSISNMNYDELQNRKSELVFEGFLGVLLLVALVLGVLLIVMIGDVSILNEDFLRDYISWFISAYGLIALGGLGIIQVLITVVDYYRCIANLKRIIAIEGGDVVE